MRLCRHRPHGLRLTQGLEEEQDDVGLGIIDQHAGDLADREVALVADRDQRGEAETARLAARDQRAGDAARLRDDSGAAAR